MELLNNSWVVGIGGGILSGLIVTLITRYLFTKKDNKEYAQKVSAVNKEVVYALRPGISEGYIPDNEVLSSLINATARKYRVERDDVYQPKQIAEELIKEIMDSSFISSETKKNYSETLAHLVTKEKTTDAILSLRVERTSIESEYRQKQTERMSAMLGITAAMGTMAVALSTVLDKPTLSSPIKELINITLPTVTVLASVLLATITMLISVKLKRSRDGREEKET
ncbi:hypothetical protein SAMN02745753_00483 [Marinomonas polaris DSM 16579]|uniref:Uncharacterized protein n=1 Tax=Marinomonas polaris DSM 16579 TaxID=1122206 RepID=A0A1M4UT45_9GAMM|nr:hypothetical protein [Marinomonas polaris]SHE59896.1 hypothetical protein SAMN02745753_00483 [Marinomonas polaris DSM 16579]